MVPRPVSWMWVTSLRKEQPCEGTKGGGDMDWGWVDPGVELPTLALKTTHGV